MNPFFSRLPAVLLARALIFFSSICFSINNNSSSQLQTIVKHMWSLIRIHVATGYAQVCVSPHTQRLVGFSLPMLPVFVKLSNVNLAVRGAWVHLATTTMAGEGEGLRLLQCPWCNLLAWCVPPLPDPLLQRRRGRRRARENTRGSVLRPPQRAALPLRLPGKVTDKDKEGYRRLPRLDHQIGLGLECKRRLGS